MTFMDSLIASDLGTRYIPSLRYSDLYWKALFMSQMQSLLKCLSFSAALCFLAFNSVSGQYPLDGKIVEELRGLHVGVGTLVSGPFVVYNEKESGNKRFSGIIPDILQEMSELSNFTYSTLYILNEFEYKCYPLHMCSIRCFVLLPQLYVMKQYSYQTKGIRIVVRQPVIRFCLSSILLKEQDQNGTFSSQMSR